MMYDFGTLSHFNKSKKFVAFRLMFSSLGKLNFLIIFVFVFLASLIRSKDFLLIFLSSLNRPHNKIDSGCIK